MNPLISIYGLNSSHILRRKTILNSSNISNSTMMSQSESYILTNLRQNNSTINFQQKNIKLKNKFFNVISNKINNYSYKNLILQRQINNVHKPNITKLNPITPKKLLNKSNSELNIKYQSFISQRIRDKILEKNNKSVPNFISKIESIILIKKYLFEQKKIYEANLKINENNTILLNKIKQKIKYLNYIIKENENILGISKYIKFLIKKRVELKYNNILLSTQIDYLKEDIKELFIKIKDKSEKLWELFGIRNLLICVKEKMPLEDLPLIFRVCNTSFLSKIIKLYNKYIDLIELKKKEILNDPLLNFRIPANLVEYIHLYMKNELDKDIFDEKYLKYLDPNKQIFKNEDEFYQRYKEIEKHAIEYYYYYNKKKNINNNYITICNNKIKSNKNEIKDINDYTEKYERILFKLKNDNNYLRIYLKTIKEKNNLKYKGKLKNEKKHDNKLNNIFLRSVINTISPEINRFYYNLNNLKKEKKFKKKNAYIYYIISRNTFEFYKQLPKYFNMQVDFSKEKLDKCINNINNLNNIPLDIITDNTVYLFRLYESAIIFFLNDYKTIKNNNKEIFNNINKEIILKRKINLVEFRKILDKKMNKLQEKKLFKKNNELLFVKEKKIHFPIINIISNKNKSERKNNNINKRIINPYSSFLDY